MFNILQGTFLILCHDEFLHPTILRFIIKPILQTRKLRLRRTLPTIYGVKRNLNFSYRVPDPPPFSKAGEMTLSTKWNKALSPGQNCHSKLLLLAGGRYRWSDFAFPSTGKSPWSWCPPLFPTAKGSQGVKTIWSPKCCKPVFWKRIDLALKSICKDEGNFSMTLPNNSAMRFPSLNALFFLWLLWEGSGLVVGGWD